MNGQDTPQPVLRLRAGTREPFTDSAGNLWQPDHGYAGGEAVDRGPISIATAGLQELYRTVRIGASGYTFPAENGRYTVLLHMVENDPAVTGKGQRVFSVRIGENELKDVDIWELSGGLHIPLVFAFAVTVRSGTLAGQTVCAGR